MMPVQQPVAPLRAMLVDYEGELSVGRGLLPSHEAVDQLRLHRAAAYV